MRRIYCVGPIAGMLLGILACRVLAKQIGVARLHLFASGRDGGLASRPRDTCEREGRDVELAGSLVFS